MCARFCIPTKTQGKQVQIHNSWWKGLDPRLEAHSHQRWIGIRQELSQTNDDSFQWKKGLVRSCLCCFFFHVPNKETFFLLFHKSGFHLLSKFRYIFRISVWMLCQEETGRDFITVWIRVPLKHISYLCCAGLILIPQVHGNWVKQCYCFCLFWCPF